MAKAHMPGNFPYESLQATVAHAGVVNYASAHVTATLALAFEQRTANLLTWHAFLDHQGDLPDQTAEIAAQIFDRMGLTND